MARLLHTEERGGVIRHHGNEAAAFVAHSCGYLVNYFTSQHTTYPSEMGEVRFYTTTSSRDVRKTRFSPYQQADAR